MKAALFCRVSSKEQEETGYSLPAQEKYLRDYALKNNFTVAKVFAVSESASGKIQRKIFNEMTRYIKENKINVLIVETTDRLTRNFADVPTIDKWILDDNDHQIHLAKESCILSNNSKSHEWFMWRVKVATAEYYVRLLSENVIKGQKEKIAQGWLPTKPPIGYTTVGEQGHKIHVIDEQKAPLVKEMFTLYATRNYSLKQLTKLMVDKGLRNANGNKIVKSRIHEYLSDPFYIGSIRWNNTETKGKHEALIDTDTFNKVQQILKGRSAPKYRKHAYLFQGLMKCGECGGTITWEIHKGIIYGHCNHYRQCTQTTWYREDEMSQFLAHEAAKLKITNTRIAQWIKKALKEGHQDKIAYHSNSLNELNQRKEQLNKRLEKMYEDKLDEKITPVFYESKSKQYQGELTEITQAIEKHRNANEKYYELGSNLYELSQRAEHIFNNAIKEDKRILINLVFSSISLENGKLTAAHSKAFQILSELVNITNGTKIEKTDKIRKMIFETEKKIDYSMNMDDLHSHRPVWLRGLDAIRTYYCSI